MLDTNNWPNRPEPYYAVFAIVMIVILIVAAL